MPYDSATKHGHKHGEAFMLMWYGCKCGHRERIWNSRDGVTPFGIGCPSCGEIANHINWGLDEYAPDYKPKHGQRFFRDGTVGEAVTIMERRIESMKEQYPLEPGQREEIMREVRETGGGEFQPGWPTVDIAT